MNNFLSRRSLIITLLHLFLVSTLRGQQVNKALELFLNNKVSEAELALTKIANNDGVLKTTNQQEEKGKAAIALALIHKLNENSDDKVKYYVKGLQSLTQPDAYAYTLWGDCYFYNYPKYAQQLLDFFATKQTVHPDINYCLDNLQRRRFILNDQFDSVYYLNKTKGYIDQWEFLGAFDYNDGFGFNNDESTLAHPEKSYDFKGKFNSTMHWFPLIEHVDASAILLNDYIDIARYNASKMYAQTFVNSPSEQEVVLNMICGTDLKCWVNDALVYTNRKNIEHINSLPVHIPIRLHKGTNRLLFQFGKKNNYSNNFEVYLRDKEDKSVLNVVAQLTDRSYSKEISNIQPVKDPDIESFNVEVFSNYLKQHPNDILEQMLRIEELNSTGDKIKTLNALTPLYTKYPNSYYLSNLYYNNKPNINYATKDDYLNQRCENCFSTLNQKFEKAIADKNKSEIKETLSKLENNFPNNLSVVLRKIDYLMEENEFAEAEKLIEDGIRKYENQLTFYSYKASLLKAQGKKHEYLNYLQSILPSRNNTFVSDRLKSYYLNENDTANWIKIIQSDMIYDKSDENFYTLINAYNANKKLDSTQHILEKLIAKKPYSANAWQEYGDLMLEKSNKTKALEYYKKVIAFNPLNYEVIKKINAIQDKKAEIEQLLPQSMKEIFSLNKVNMIEVPSYLKNKNWVILLKKSASVLYEGGLHVSKNYVFYKILNEAGINEFKEFPGTGSDVLIFKQDGQVVLPESNYSALVLPNLTVGDIIGMKYESESSVNNEYSSIRFQELISNLENDPLVYLEEQHIISKKLNSTPFLNDKNKLFQIEKKDWNDEFLIYTIRSKNPIYIEPEMYSSELLFNNSFMVAHNYSSWDEVSKWYWDIASPSLVADDTIKQIVRRELLGKNQLKQFEKAKLLYQWIEKNINYSSQSFRQDNYVPQLPSKVVQDKLGDCKDLSALFIVMCKEANIACNFCLVNMDTRAGMYKQYPNINFNHCIARMYADGNPYFVELTSKSLPFAQTVNYATYAYGLEIQADKIVNITTLFNEHKFDIFHLYSDINVNQGKLALKGTIQINGVTSSILKDAFEKIDSSQINTSLQKLVTDIIPNSKIDSCSYNAKDKWNDTVIVQYSADNDQMFTDIADLYIYKFYTFLSKIVEESIFANDGRKTDISFLQSTGMVGEALNKITIEIPSGKSIFKKPTNSLVSNSFFDYSVELTETNKQLIITRKFISKVNVIKAKDFIAYKSEMEKAYKNDLVTIVMQ